MGATINRDAELVMHSCGGPIEMNHRGMRDQCGHPVVMAHEYAALTAARRLSAAAQLHRPDVENLVPTCPTCRVASPCPTWTALTIGEGDIEVGDMMGDDR